MGNSSTIAISISTHLHLSDMRLHRLSLPKQDGFGWANWLTRDSNPCFCGWESDVLTIRPSQTSKSIRLHNNSTGNIIKWPCTRLYLEFSYIMHILGLYYSDTRALPFPIGKWTVMDPYLSEALYMLFPCWYNMRNGTGTFKWKQLTASHLLPCLVNIMFQHQNQQHIYK